MVTGGHDKNEASPFACRTLLNRIPERHRGLPSSLVILFLLLLASNISSCYAGPVAQSVSSSGVSVSTPETQADQKIHHFVQLKVEEPLPAYLQEIQKALYAIQNRLAHLAPPQQPCSVNVSCPEGGVGSSLDPSLKKQLADIERKINELKGLYPAGSGIIEPCQVAPPIPQGDPHKVIIDSRKSLGDCVSWLILQVEGLELMRTEQPFPKDTRANEELQARRDAEIFIIDNLIQRIDELSKQAKHLKEALNKEDNHPLRAILVSLFFAVIIIIFSSLTTKYITRFMREHYEGDGTNVFQNFAHLLAAGSEQLSEEERHYSNLRFAIFTIFIAICGALGTIYLSKDYQDTTKSMHNILPIIGILVTIVFASLEFAIDWIETEYGYMAKAIWFREVTSTRRLLGISIPSNSVSIGGATDVMDWVRCPIWAIFGLAVNFWLYLLWHQYQQDQQEDLWIISGLTGLIGLLVVVCFWRFLYSCGRCFRERLSNHLRCQARADRPFWMSLLRYLIGRQ